MKRREICSNLRIKTPEWRQWRRSGVFIVTFKHISGLFVVFLFLILNIQMLTEWVHDQMILTIEKLYKCTVPSQLTFTFSMPTMETLEKGVK